MIQSLRTIIIDDEPIALEKLRNYVAKVPFLECVAECESGLEAIEYLSRNSVDLVFTDINMPDLSGLEFVESLTCRPMVVFTTAYSEYAIESYRVSAVDYLLKPYSFADFQRAANKALELARNRDADDAPVRNSLFVKTDHRYVRVALDDIRFIKGYGEYLQIHVSGSSTPLLTLSSFATIMERLTPNFIQVHRSYIVNMDKVGHIERNRIVMGPDDYIPVSDSYKGVMQQYLATHSIGRGPK